MNWEDDITPLSPPPAGAQHGVVVPSTLADVLDLFFLDRAERGAGWTHGNMQEQRYRQRQLLERHLAASDSGRLVDAATGKNHLVIVAACGMRAAHLDDLISRRQKPRR